MQDRHNLEYDKLYDSFIPSHQAFSNAGMPWTDSLKPVFLSAVRNFMRNYALLLLPIRLTCGSMSDDRDKFRQACTSPTLWDGKQHIGFFGDPAKNKDIHVIWEGLEANLAAGVLGAWTAFETLAGDLWAAAVSANPIVLGALEGKPAKRIIDKSKGKDVDYDSPSVFKKESDKTIPLTDLLDYAKVWKEKMWEGMGELLRDRFGFTKLRGIREAYGTAFPINWKGVVSEKIDKILADESLDALSVFRNVIVHKASIADSKAIEALKWTKYADECAEGKKVELTATLVRSLIDPVVSMCAELIAEVDKWLVQVGK